MYKFIISISLFFGAGNLLGQDALVYSLSLKNVVDLAISQSSAVKYVQNQDVNYYWRWKNHQTRFRPQLMLSGVLPDFENQTKPIVQPDGSIEFHKVTRLETSANLALNQNIAKTGPVSHRNHGVIFSKIGSGLKRGILMLMRLSLLSIFCFRIRASICRRPFTRSSLLSESS